MTLSKLAPLLLLLMAASAQEPVRIDSPNIRAELHDGSTVVVVPLTSSVRHTQLADLELAWVGPNGDGRPVTTQLLLEAGRSEIRVPLTADAANVWSRLRYRLLPRGGATFYPQSGVLSLPHIAPHAFEIRAAVPGFARPGQPVTVLARAIHPVTGRPANVEWTATLRGDQEVPPRTKTFRPDGYLELVFDVPLVSGDLYATLEIQARNGDFQQAVSLRASIANRLTARMLTDKPLYQTGQTLHWRAAVLDPQGRAAAKTPVQLTIEDPDGDQVLAQPLETSTFGIVHHDWQIPASASSGPYRIRLDYADGGDIASHTVQVRRYELPTFRVMVEADRSTVLPGETVRATIRAQYLFGKPVPNARVKIGLGSKIIAEGQAGPDGVFRAELPFRREFGELTESGGRFEDLNLTASATDPDSGRTEQREFTVRLTTRAIHVYLISEPDGRAFVSASYAAGRPAEANVELTIGSRTIRARTNRYGLAKVQIPDLEREIVRISVVDADGLAGSYSQSPGWRKERHSLDPGKTIHRPGDPVAITVRSPNDASATATLMLFAMVDGRQLASRLVSLTKHQGQVSFPYQPEFQGVVSFVAWDPDNERGEVASRNVFFTGGSRLKLTVAPERPTYRPGESATLRMQVSQDGRPAQAALALAVVDQALFERVRTDAEVRSRFWIYRHDPQPEIAGIGLLDLGLLKPETPVSPELDLVAEALLAGHFASLSAESSDSLARPPDFPELKRNVDTLESALERHFHQTLEIPQNLEELAAVAGFTWWNALDPWGQPLDATFHIEQTHRVVPFHTSGPDQIRNTADDFVAGAFRASYFRAQEALIRRALTQNGDYPATAQEFAQLLNERGIRIEAFRDPWNTPCRWSVTTRGPRRHITITSAGPDAAFQTGDDFVLAEFNGEYFSRERERLRDASGSADPPPLNLDAWVQTLRKAGIDLSAYRDAWGRPYRRGADLTWKFGDRIDSYTAQVYRFPPEILTRVIPVASKVLVATLRSDGPDGVPGTKNDFDIARFPLVIEESDAGSRGTPPPMPRPAKGSGTIAGVVIDATGAVIPGAKVTLADVSGQRLLVVADPGGRFVFAGLPVGLYRLEASSPGFRTYRLLEVPVVPTTTTPVRIRLDIGSVSESVEVRAEPAQIATQSAEAVRTPERTLSTPRIREEFPETLFWQPEVLTSPAGTSVTRVPLADSITTWKVAAVASTRDGLFADSITTWKVAAVASTRDGLFAEAEADLRAFLPFFLDFQPPATLTQGDRIQLPVLVRNYQSQPANVTVSLEPNGWSALSGAPSRTVSVPAESSVPVTFPITAKTPDPAARQRILASAGNVSDGIEKPLTVRPDGREVLQTSSELTATEAELLVDIPSGAIPGATHSELRLYPNAVDLLWESANALMRNPLGCAEQTASGGYSNLVALRFGRALKLSRDQQERRALLHVHQAIDGLSRFRDARGGYGYWGGRDPNIAVTAHVASFLVEASAVTNVDRHALQETLQWIEKAQGPSGLWNRSDDDLSISNPAAYALTAHVVRTLALARKAGFSVADRTFANAYSQLVRTGSRPNTYVLSHLILAALHSGHEPLARDAAAELKQMARPAQGGVYWETDIYTPFYGWGSAARIEATSLALQALAGARARNLAPPGADAVIRQGAAFLLRTRGYYGHWDSTQTTMQAMRVLTEILPSFHGAARWDLRVNGRKIPIRTADSDRPRIDLSPYLTTGVNRIRLKPQRPAAPLLIQLATRYAMPWAEPRPTSSDFDFRVQFSKRDGARGEPVNCDVFARSASPLVRGMMIACLPALRSIGPRSLPDSKSSPTRSCRIASCSTSGLGKGASSSVCG